MANFEWFLRKVSDLGSDVERSLILSELKLALNAHNNTQQKYIAQNLPLDVVFDCLNTSERDEIDSACQILSSLLGSLDPNVVLGQYGANLKRALGHPFSKVKVMAIGEFRRSASTTDLIPQLCQDDLLLDIVACLKSEDIAVARNASGLLLKLGMSSVGLKVLFSPQILQGLKDVQNHSDIVRFRVFEMVVLVAERSREGLQACVASGLLPALIAELQTEDVLLQLNALELLTKLALKPYGLQWLQQKGVLRQLAEKVTTIDEEPLGSLLLPGLIKFFGNMAQSSPKEFFHEYPAMVTALFETFDTSDMVLLGVAMETVGYIATSVEGKFMLHNLDHQMKEVMSKLAESITSCPSETRVKALNTLASIIELKLVDQETQALAVTRDFFQWLAADPMGLVMGVCRQPFPELRLAAFQVLRALAEQEWGQLFISSTAGVMEFLLDRGAESTKSCKDGKFEVVKTIVESPTAASVFGADVLSRLTDHVQEGPFFVQGQTEVAIEGAS